MTLKITEQLREGNIIKVNGEEIRYHRIEANVNGHPRYVVHFLALGIKLEDYGNPKLSRLLSAKVYKAKWYGGGYVLSSFNFHDDLKWNIEQVKKFYGGAN